MKTASGGTPHTRKRDLVTLLNSATTYWETVREKHGKWYATARTTTRQGRPYRASATNERQAMESLCRRLGLL